jgi:hypothetical protein
MKFSILPEENYRKDGEPKMSGEWGEASPILPQRTESLVLLISTVPQLRRALNFLSLLALLARCLCS